MKLKKLMHDFLQDYLDQNKIVLFYGKNDLGFSANFKASLKKLD